jgi:hypothetical protein
VDVADIFSDLDDHGFEDTDTARKLAVLNDVYHDVCSREPWPFLEAMDTSLTLSGNVLTADNNIRAVLFLHDGTRELIPMRMDDFLRAYGQSIDNTGTATVYYFLGNELRLYPQPSDATGLILVYIRREADLTDVSVSADILLPSEFHRNVLVNGCLYKLYAMEDDGELAAGFQQYYEEAIARMREALWKRQYQRLEVLVASEYDDPTNPGW